MATDGSNLRIVAPAIRVSDSPPVCSPSGNRLTFTGVWHLTSSPDRGYQALYPAGTERDELTLIDETIFHHRGTPGGEYSIAWSPDGSRIAFTRPEGGLYVADAGGGNQITLTSDQASILVWFPNGNEILYLDGKSDDLRVVDAEGLRDSRQFSVEQLQYGYLTDSPWSPDGSLLAVYSRPSMELPTLSVIQLDGSRRVIVGEDDWPDDYFKYEGGT